MNSPPGDACCTSQPPRLFSRSPGSCFSPRSAPLPPYDQWPIQDEHPPPLAQLEPAWDQQARITRDALAAVRDWSHEVEYRVTPEVSHVKKPLIVTATYGDIAMQMVLHEVHHRAQAMNMLRQLGITLTVATASPGGGETTEPCSNDVQEEPR